MKEGIIILYFNKRNILLAIIILSSLFLFGCSVNEVLNNDSDVLIINPYSQVEWANVNYYKANLHTHTTQSDGIHSPKEVINEYNKYNYDILALTDHNEYTWPWDDYIDNLEDLNLLAIEGSEISNTHHIGSYFNNYTSQEQSEETVLNTIEKNNGLSVFFHPGRYQKNIDWYVDFINEYNSLIGIEIFNQNDRYPNDRKKWDEILSRLTPENLVWGFANDDMHNIPEHFGWHYNIILSENKSLDNVKKSIKNGSFYIYNPSTKISNIEFVIKKITINRDEIELVVDGDFSTIEWVSFSKKKNKSIVVATGNKISINYLDEKSNFIRAKISSAFGTIYTQPFGLIYN